MKRLTISAIVFVAAAFASAEAAAQATGYATPAAYDAAVGAPLFQIDFDGSTGALVPGTSFSPHVSFLSPESPDPTLVLWSSDAITDAGGSAAVVNGVSNLAGVFAAPVNAFAFDFLSGTVESVELRDAANAVIAVVPAGAGFFGVVSEVPIQSFSLNQLFFTTDPPARDRVFIDNFRADDLLPSVDDLHAAVCELIDGLDPAADMTHPNLTVNENRKNALHNRCEAVGHAIAEGDIDDAIDQLLSIRAKADDDGVNDWIQGPAAAALVNAIDALVAALLAG